MDFNKDISKIVYPIFWIIALAFYWYQYFWNYQIKKFVEIYNEQWQYISEVFKWFWDKAVSNAFWDTSKIKITNNEYDRSVELTNIMINDWCKLLKRNEDRCDEVNNKLLSILEFMLNNNIEELEEGIKGYNYDFWVYKTFLANEWVEF